MIIKQAFLGIFQKLMVFCCAMFLGFANAFSANLPAGYQQVEYIQSTGTQYIDTGIKASLNTKAEGEFEIPSGDVGQLFGSYDAGAYFRFYVPTSSLKANIFDGVGLQTSLVPGDVSRGTKIKITLDKTGLYVGNNTFAYDGTPSAFTATSNIYIGMISSYTGGTVSKGKVYSFKLYNNGTLVRDFVPVKKTVNGTDVYGMYNVLDSNPETAFYTNQGTGEFTGGPEVCPNGGTLQTYVSATGTVVQNGTPTPTNPITPTFYTQGNMVLRKVGDYADSYDATTGKITRRIGVVIFNGTEELLSSATSDIYSYVVVSGDVSGYSRNAPVSTHYIGSDDTNANMPLYSVKIGPNSEKTKISIYIKTGFENNLAGFKQFLANQYAAGTPVIIYYPLATPVEEDWAAEQCSSPIKIATRAYNTTQFAPVVTALNTAIDTIKDVVTNTINQTAAVAALQSTKQTRPDEECPAGKKCLLVEDVDGTPHWYEIIENIYGLPSGYTPLEYIQSTGTQYIHTGVTGFNTGSWEIYAKWMLPVATQPKEYANVFSVYAGEDYNSYRVITKQKDSSAYYVSGNSKAGGGSVALSDRAINQIHTAIARNGSVIFDGETITTSTKGTALPSDASLGIFAKSDGNGKIIARIYSVNVKKDGALIRDFVPAKNASGVIGMYDLADPNPATAFHTNAGTGEFTAGPEI